MDKCIWHWHWAGTTGGRGWEHLHLSQLLITLDWIITSISINKHKNRVLELGSSLALWTVSELRAHNTIFQISIKSKCWESLPPFMFFYPSKQPTNGSFRSVDLYVSYLTFDFSKYKHFVLWLSIDFPQFRPKRDSSAVPLGPLHCQIPSIECAPPIPISIPPSSIYYYPHLCSLGASELDFN